MIRVLLSLLTALVLTTLPLSAQSVRPPANAVVPADPGPSALDTSAPVQTLEDVLARQRGERVDDSARRAATGDPNSAAAIAAQLGALGGASKSDKWRAARFNTADLTVSSHGPGADVLIQDSGMTWLEFRRGPLRTYGGWLLLGTLAMLAIFYLIRGRIRIDGRKTGRTVLRFAFSERFAHWLMAGSFILLALTGLLLLFGRVAIIPLFGHEVFSPIATGSKFVHDNISWAFMLGLILAFVFWVAHNLPAREDFTWLARGGGIVGGGHPPAKKFNAGQKLIFWSVILLGTSIAISGLSLLFPFELPLFAKTFAFLNQIGVGTFLGDLFGIGALPEVLAPHEEMQLAQTWHAIVGFVLMAIILAHIYIGSIGMEGAFDAMGSGEVEEQWAREHHSLWLADVKEKERAHGTTGGAATPAE